MIALALLACDPGERVVVVTVPGDGPADTGTGPTTSDDAWTATGDPPPTDTTPPTSDSGPAPDPEPVDPAITTVDLVELDDVLEVHVHTVAGTAPLDGGSLLVELDGGGVTELAIPDDVTSFADGEAVVLLDRPKVGECTLGADHAVEVELVDAEGRSSGPADAAITTSDVGMVLDEIGESYAEELGVVARGTILCGDLDLVSNNGLLYTGDLDYATFGIGATGDYTIELRWEVAGDWDLLIYSVSSAGTWTSVASANGPDVHGPETATAHLYAGLTYAFEVAGWDGYIGDWTVEIR